MSGAPSWPVMLVCSCLVVGIPSGQPHTGSSCPHLPLYTRPRYARLCDRPLRPFRRARENPRCLSLVCAAGEFAVLGWTFSLWMLPALLSFRELLAQKGKNRRGDPFPPSVTSVSLPPFVSRRGLSNTNQRLSLSGAASWSRQWVRGERERERERESALFKRETEHLCLRPPFHGIGEGPR